MLWGVLALNLGYFAVEFAVALAIGSVSLFADSIDFLEDAPINFLIFVALGWSVILRARVGYRTKTGANPPPGVRKFVVCPW